jgi:methionyl-tRNA formyltransferase
MNPASQATMPTPFSCFLLGSDSLLLSCADVLLSQGHDVRGVVSTAPAVRAWAEGHGIPTFRRATELVAAGAGRPVDWLFSITNLAILPPEVLALPRRGAVNFHDGPLPRYGGLRAPAWALMAGEQSYGISWHLMTDAPDEGDLLLQRVFPIEPDDTSLTLNTRCFEAAVASFPELVAQLASGAWTATCHVLDRATYHGLDARPAGQGHLDWRRPAGELAALVRALDFGGYPNPLSAAKVVAGRSVVLARSVRGVGEAGSAAPGTVLSAEGEVLEVAATGGALRLTGLATADGAPLAAADALAQLGGMIGAVLPVSDPTFLVQLDAFMGTAGRH